MSAHPPCFVVVDDEPSVRAVLVRLLTRMYPQYGAAACAGSAEALAMITTGSVVGVLTDYALGTDTGVMLAQTIRARWPTLPVVLISGLLTDEITAAALTAGCVAVLSKPVDRTLLWTTFQSAL